MIRYICLGLLATQIRAETGCMAATKHRNLSDGYDYKKMHLVKCSCPCSRYERLDKRGRCERCRHYRRPIAALDLDI